jgi:hypothetical protein
VLPKSNKERITREPGIELIGVANLQELMEVVFG